MSELRPTENKGSLVREEICIVATSLMNFFFGCALNFDANRIIAVATNRALKTTLIPLGGRVSGQNFTFKKIGGGIFGRTG